MLNKWFAAILVGSTLMLAACGDKDKEDEKEFDAVEANKVIEEGTVGFEVVGETIEEATNVPKEAKKEIEAAFNEYMAAFNSEDINRYMATVSKNPKGFNYDEEKEYTVNIFEQFDTTREATDVTIVNYNENEAQVFANLSTEVQQSSNGAKLSNSGQQVTVFVKEEATWKVTSVFFKGNDSQAQTESE